MAEEFVFRYGANEFMFGEYGVKMRAHGETEWEYQYLSYRDLAMLLNLKNKFYHKHKPDISIGELEWKREVARQLSK